MDEIAEALKTQREALGLRIEDIFERTRINPEFLEALEMGQYSVLPETYIRLFLRTYANELGLDGDALVAHYEKLYTPPTPEPEQHPPQREQSSMPLIVIAVGALFVIAIFIIQFSTNNQEEPAAPLDTAVASAPIKQFPSPQKEAPTAIVQKDTLALQQTGTALDSAVAMPPAQPVEQPAATEPVQQPDQPIAQTPDESLAAENDSAVAETNIPVLEAPIANSTPPVQEPAANQALPSTNDQTDIEDTTSNPITQRVISNTPPVQEPAPPELAVYDLPLPRQMTEDQPMVLSGIVRQTTRLRVAADGRSIFSGELRAGSRPRWQARDSFRVQMDQANAIELSLQGESLSPSPSPHHSIRLLVTRTQIQVEELPDTNR